MPGDFGIAEISAIAATAVSAASAVAGGISQSRAADYSAQIAATNAAQAQAAAAQNAAIQAAQARQQQGAAVAAYGASGVDPGAGSPLDVLASSAYAAELDRQTILQRGRLQALGFEDQAALDRAASGTAIENGVGSAVGVLLAGGADYYTSFPGTKTAASGGAPGRGFGLGAAGTTASGQDY
jgi:hypothetical protein